MNELRKKTNSVVSEQNDLSNKKRTIDNTNRMLQKHDKIW